MADFTLLRRMDASAFYPPGRYQVEARSHGCHDVTVFEPAPLSSGREIAVTFGATVQSFLAKLMTPLAKLILGSTRKLMENDLDDLQRICESASAADA